MKRHLLSIVLLGLSALFPAAAHAGAADWMPIPPGGSMVQVLAAVPGSATVFAGTAYGGVFRSFDRGLSWSAANRGLSGLDVKVLAVGPAGSGTLYAGFLAAIRCFNGLRAAISKRWGRLVRCYSIRVTQSE